MTQESLRTNDEISNIIEAHANTVYRLALTRTGNQTDAEDIFQEVFLKLKASNPVFESEEHTKAWLIRVTINLSKNLHSSGWFRRTLPLEVAAQEIGEEDITHTEDIFLIVQQLPQKYRTVLHLFYYHDYSIAEISQLLHTKESTIASQLSRGRRMLKEKLKGEYEYEKL